MPKSTTVLSKLVTSRIFTYACLVIILGMGGLFRLTNLDWDEEQHQHPDERFLTMVTADMTWPENFEHYFDPLTSELSPYANNPEVWYVYGTVPIYLTKWVAVTLDKDSFNEIYLVGRALSGMFDLGCIFFLFLIARRLYDDRVALLSAALYALAAHPIQLSHFFTVDTFANFFVVMTIYWSLRASERGIWLYYLFMGISLGAGMASKMSVLTLGVVVVLAGVLDFYRFYKRTSDVHSALEHLMVRWATVGITMLLVFRILQPIAFEGPGFFNFRLLQIWKDDIDQMRALVDGTQSVPYLIQWTDRTPLWFPWKNMVIWGMGLPLGIAAWGGWLLASYELIRYRKVVHLLPVFYIGITFLYHGTRWVMYMRYFMPIYPLLALMAGYLVIWVWNRARAGQRAHQNDARNTETEASNESDTPDTTIARTTHTKRLYYYALAALLTIVVLGGTGLYALAFTSIYTRTITRIEASRWIYANIPRGSALANEHWDDSLPLRIDGNDGFYDWYTDITMENYNGYSPEKLTMIVDNLTQADYVILSSNRLYGSIPRMPLRYPIATRYYHLLFDEQLGFHKVAEFTSYPQLFGYELPDQDADESFSVYDHPNVMIYQKGDDFDPQQVQYLLQSDIDWYTVIDMTPKKATSAPTGLMFMRDDRDLYQESGTWSDMFNPASLSNRYPVVFWFLAIEIIGVIALPITLVVFRAMHDRGYIFSKAIGLLLVGWGSWLVANWRWVSFSQATIVLIVLLLLLISGILFGTRFQEMTAAVRSRWRIMLFAEVLFWLLFAGLALIRWNNPDLWFTPDNEDNPISLATLTAVVKSPYFPPYDPWFSGGYLNIPYLGYVLVAVLIKLTSIVPSIAYNLALPTWIALAAVGTWSIVYNLVAGLHTAPEQPSSSVRANARRGQAIALGILALFLVTLAGNMKQVQFIVSPTVSAHSYLDVSHIIPVEEGEPSLRTEFPFFAFLAGDLSPQMLALPFLLLIVALAVQTIRQPIAPARYLDKDGDSRKGAKAHRPDSESDSVYNSSHIGRSKHEVGVLLLLALCIGALWTLHTWDVVPATLIIAGVCMLWAYRRQYHQRAALQAQHGFRYGEYCKLTRPQPWERFHDSPPPSHEHTRTWQTGPDLIAIGWSVIWRTGFIVLLGYLAFLPFHQAYGSPYDGLALWKESRMPLEAYLVINGLFFFITTSFLLLDVGKWAGQNSIVRLLNLIVRHWQRLPRMHRLYRRLVQTQLWHELALYALLFAVVFVVLLIVFKQLVLALSVLLLTLSLLLLLRHRSDLRTQLTLLLIGLGHALMIATNLVTLKSYDAALEAPARIEIVQVLSFQLWVIWGLASAACIAFIAPRLRIAGMSSDMTDSEEKPITPKPKRRIKKQVMEGLASLGTMVWWLVCAALVVSAAHYTVFGTLDTLDNSQATLAHAATLDGMATMQGTAYTFAGTEVSLDEEREAIAWMHEHISGSPVIVECPYPDYTLSMRVSTLTGLPVVIGWPAHEKQQRALLPAHIVDTRLRDVDGIYTEPDPDAVLSLLRKHQVEFVYIGALERYRYGEHIVGNFENGEGQYWDRVYENGDVRVYRVR